MRIAIAPDRPALGQFVALKAAEILRTVLQSKRTVNLVVATGSSQFEVLSSLVSQPDVEWNRVHGFHLDEYLGIADSHPASFCGYLKDRFVSRVPLASFHFMNGTFPANKLKQQADAALSGHEIDLMLCGIGENGHLAFNDPPANFEAEDPYLIVELDEACRRQQVGEGWFDSMNSVPTQAISMSIRQIMKSKAILCTVPDRRKAEAVRNSVEGPVTNQVPASILQQHANTLLALDTGSSSLLSTATTQTCEMVSA
ncbi:MAG: glucosamine-6-phosphate deaminase [Pirellulales bacterium]